MLVILGDCRNPGQSHVTIPTGIATVGNPSGIAKPVAIPSGIAAGIVKITFDRILRFGSLLAFLNRFQRFWHV